MPNDTTQNERLCHSKRLIFDRIRHAVKKKAGCPALPGMAVESVITGILDGAIFGTGTLMPALWSLVPATPDPMAVTSQPREGFLMVFER